MKKFITTLVLLTLITLKVLGQGSIITGTIIDGETNSPLPGVSIVLKGSGVMAMTDSNGKYEINVLEGDGILVFSMQGMLAQEMPVDNRSLIDVSMEAENPDNINALQTALGIRRSSENLTHKYQGLYGKDVSIDHGYNVLGSLSGKLTGIDIKTNNNLGGSTNMLIRGFKSFYGNNQPMLIVDGVPYDNTITNTLGQMICFRGYDYGIPTSDLNPDNIESVNILEGPGATSLFGSRGGNGVVIITTKNMNTEKSNIELTLNVGGSFGSYDPSTFPKYQKEYGQGFGPYYEDPSGYFLYRDINGDGNPELIAPLSEDGSYGAKFDPGLMVYQWDAFDAGSPNYGKPTPWVAAEHDPSYILEHPKSYHTGFQLTTRAANGYFNFGYNRTNETGVMPNSRLTRNFLNIGSSHSLFKTITLTTSINYSNIDARGRYPTGRCTNENPMVSFREWFAANVDLKDLEEAYFRNHENVTWHLLDPSNPIPLYWDNPYFALYENFETDSRDRLTGFIGVMYKITDWLSLSGEASLDTYKEKQEERIAVGSVNKSSYSRFDRSWRENNYEITLNFDKDFKGIRITGLAGGNIRQAHEDWIRATTSGGLKIPGVYALYNSVDPIDPPEESDIKKQVNSVFANLLVSYKNMIYIEGSFRRDHFSGIPHIDPSESYMSVGTGYLFSGLLGNPDWLEFGKLRINYGEAGNEFRNGFLPPSYEIAGSFNGNPLSSVTDAGYPYPLSFERTKGTEVGLEMTFLNNRIGFDLTRYYSSSKDQILSIPVSGATGYDKIYLNSGEMKNNGWELYIHGIALKYSNFSWSAGLNWTRNRNKVVHVHTQFPEKIIGAFPGGIVTWITEGEPYGVIKGSNFSYNERGRKIVGNNGFYKYYPGMFENIGYINPDWLAGFSNTFKYKNFSLSVLLDFRHGGNVFNVDMFYGMGTGLYPETTAKNDLGNPMRNSIEEGGGIIFDGVQEDGSVNYTRVRADHYGVLGWVRMPAAGFIYDAGYVKLREMIFTWSVPDKLVRKIGVVKNIDVSLTGHNLWILHKNVPYADPEYFAGAGNYAFGFQAGTYPAVRYYGFNLRVDF